MCEKINANLHKKDSACDSIPFNSKSDYLNKKKKIVASQEENQKRYKNFTEDRELDNIIGYILKNHNNDATPEKLVGDLSTSSIIEENNKIDIDELEKLFLFLLKLNPQQIRVLNQYRENLDKLVKLPIVFTSEFKNTLTHNQRLEMSNLKLMSLRRYSVLKDPYGKIDIDNFNFTPLNEKNLKNNSLVNIKNFSNMDNILIGYEKHKHDKRIYQASPSTRKDEVQKKKKQNLLKEGMKHPQFVKFKQVIHEYYQNNLSLIERREIDDETLYKVTKELSTDEMQSLIDNPEVFIEFLNSGGFDNKYDSDEEENEVKNKHLDDIIEEEEKNRGNIYSNRLEEIESERSYISDENSNKNDKNTPIIDAYDKADI